MIALQKLEMITQIERAEKVGRELLTKYEVLEF